jgi:hypothetical protein
MLLLALLAIPGLATALPAKCEQKEFAETQAKYQQCAAAKIASITGALEVRPVSGRVRVVTAASREQSMPGPAGLNVLKEGPWGESWNLATTCSNSGAVRDRMV